MSNSKHLNDVIIGRMASLNEMYDNIYSTTCDEIIEWWICEFPDEPTVDDLLDIARDDAKWDNAWNTYDELMDEWVKYDE